MGFKEETIRAYDNIAADYNRANLKSFWREEFQTYSSLIFGKKIIDIGSGAGRDAMVFTENGFEYTGVDASQAMLDIARTRAPQGIYRKMDFYHLDFSNDTFDGFWAAASFLHVPKSDVSTVMAEAKRIIRPSGIGFISVKEKEKDGMDEGVIEEKERYGIARYFAFYEEEEFRRCLLRAGFEIIGNAKYHEDNERHTTWLGFFVRKPPIQN